jgi:hypothetical protein
MLVANPQLACRVRHSFGAITNLGGNESDALVALLTALEDEGPTVQVIDMLEDGLDVLTQEALICFLRRRKLPLLLAFAAGWPSVTKKPSRRRSAAGLPACQCA